ncbi:GmrSD restriction endonuclease domain-containing protein [Micromonospora lupini]|uniref:GmrSD restriction endonuclease domain-containing protein n=1 Tax=Micromonospora lupini TaxID=285679 RepID=UPI0033DAB60C
MSIQEAYRLFRDDVLLVDRRYQRKLVWTVSEKQLLIQSILEGYPIPLILFADRPESHGKGKYAIIDGMQRLDAIFSFIEQRFAFMEKYFDVEQNARAKQAAEEGGFEPQLSAPTLSPKECAEILDYQLAVTVYPASIEQQITQVFSRINASGRQLSAQEKRQAGVINSFTELVRGVASNLRGDASADLLLLRQMPSISIDSVRERQQYGVRADETLWCQQGVLTVKQLREGEDEQMIADIAASVLFDEPLAVSKELLDDLYNPGSPDYERLLTRLATHGREKLAGELEAVFSVLGDVLETTLPGQNGLRNLVRGSGSNPIKTPFYAIFMAFYKLIIEQEKAPADYAGIVNALSNVSGRLTTGRHYVSVDDRTKNIKLVAGLIGEFFAHKVPPVFGHGPGLAMDFENALRRSKIETAKYEFKQGVLRLDHSREWEDSLADRLAETACAIANANPHADGYLFIGVADTEKDARRIELLDRVVPKVVGSHHVVGIDREARTKGLSIEAYVERIVSWFRNSGLSEPLSTGLLANVDTIDYRGLSVIRVRIPAQSEIAFVRDQAFVREGSSKVAVEGRQLAALVRSFH